MRRRSFVIFAALTAIASGCLGGVAAGAPTGSGWSIQPSPNPPGATASVLSAVSCPDDGTCTAVGRYYLGTTLLTLAERWDGSSWAIEPTPNPAGAQALLTGLACPAPHVCIAVGYSVTTKVRALVERWDGTTWTIVPTPRPHGAFWVELQAVSCTGGSDCTAVGASIGRGVDAQERPLAEHWDGASWTIERTPNPHAENGSWLTGVACVGTGACEAVGNYAYADVDQSVFAFGWNGTRWVQQQQPNPGGADLNSDASVSCSSAVACTSVGSWTDGSQRIRGLAERWDGTSWTQERAHNPSGFAISELLGVSCAGGSACTAVGDWSGSYSGIPTSTLAERWDGTNWRIGSTPDPQGATESILASVDCSSARACVAVGSSYAAGVTSTVVESYAG